MIKWTLLILLGPISAVLAFSPRPTDALTSPDHRFGMTEVFWLPDEASDLGVGWERILFYWREVQPEGPDDWNTLHVREEWLDEAAAQGREVVGLIKNTAPWASVDGTEAGLPKGLYLPDDDPGNLWANYVRRLAAYYGERNVHHWIIWNEPEIDEDVYGFEFAGSVDDYYQLLKVAYRVIKETDPEAVIHLAGLTWWHDPAFLDELLTIASADPEGAENNYFFDVISLHIYFRTETVKSIIEEVGSIQTRYGLDKPIWINETNAPPNRDPEWPVDRPRFNIDLEQQAWFILHAMALGFGSGAERVSVYKLLDIHLPPGGESFGVLRPDQSKRPAYSAFKMATQCFGNFEKVDMTVDPLHYRVTFTRPGSLTHVAWARTQNDSAVHIESSSDEATLMRLSQDAEALSPVEGQYTLTLPGQRCDEECLVGGEPIVLVEALDETGRDEACRQYMSPGVIEAADSMPEVDSGQGKSEAKDTVTSLDLEIDAPAKTEPPVTEDQRSGHQAVVAVETDESAVPSGTPDVGATLGETSGLDGVEGGSDDQVEASVEERDLQTESAAGSQDVAGLWLLGIGLVLGLVMAFLAWRARSNQIQ